MRFSPHGIAFDNGGDYRMLFFNSDGSVVTVLTLLGKVSGRHVRVDMTGGTLYVDVERDGDGRVTDLYLTGPTNIVCKGEAVDENMKWREQTVKKPARLQVSEGSIV